MSNIETIEKEISSHWDDQIETDVRQGKLASLAQMAVQEHKDGKTTRI